jgi:hypothetical protein
MLKLNNLLSRYQNKNEFLLLMARTFALLRSTGIKRIRSPMNFDLLSTLTISTPVTFRSIARMQTFRNMFMAFPCDTRYQTPLTICYFITTFEMVVIKRNGKIYRSFSVCKGL